MPFNHVAPSSWLPPTGPILKAGVSGLRLRVTLTIRGGLGLLCLHTRHILFSASASLVLLRLTPGD